MFSIAGILTVVLIVIVLVILFKLLGLIESALGIPAPWATIIYWIIVLIAVIWAFGFFGITQPLVR